jgi:hypothetical protein
VLPRPCLLVQMVAMAQPISTQQMPVSLAPARKGRAVVAMAGAALGAVVLLGTLALWFHYGTAVFFEMIASGIAACL